MLYLRGSKGGCFRGTSRVLNSISKDIRVLKGISGIRASMVFISGREADKEVLDILYSRSCLLSFYSLFNLCLL
jgi:hypothetical protein